MNHENNVLSKFIKSHQEMFEIALNEIEHGKKQSHWMWYIFPQVQGLGLSEISNYYALKSKEEAQQYYHHAYLYDHYNKICQALLKLKTNNPIDVFGKIDALKLQSSLTLFHLVDKENVIIQNVLIKFYDGKMDEKTVEIYQQI